MEYQSKTTTVFTSDQFSNAKRGEFVTKRQRLGRKEDILKGKVPTEITMNGEKHTLYMKERMALSGHKFYYGNKNRTSICIFW